MPPKKYRGAPAPKTRTYVPRNVSQGGVDPQLEQPNVDLEIARAASPAPSIERPASAPPALDQTVVTVTDRVKNRPVFVGSAEYAAMAVASDYGVSCKAIRGKDTNAHQVSAMLRMAAYLRFLRQAGNQPRLEVLSWYGADRDIIKIDGLEVTLVQDSLVAGDASREFSHRVTMDWQGLWDVAWVCDVYQEGESSDEALSPALIRRLCAVTRQHRCYGLFRRFIGHCGADVYPWKDSSGTVRHQIEGAWYKDANGFVVFAPEPDAHPYAPHPELGWLGERSVEGLDVSLVANYGPYGLYCFAESDASIELQAMPAFYGAVEWLHLNKPDTFWNRVQDFLGVDTIKQRVLVDRHIMQVLNSTAYALRPPSAHALDTVIRQVDAQMRISLLWMGLKAHPFGCELASKATIGTALYIIYGQRVEAVETLYTTRAAYAHTEQILDDARRSVFAPLPFFQNLSWIKKIGIVVLGLLVARYIYLKRNAPPRVQTVAKPRLPYLDFAIGLAGSQIMQRLIWPRLPLSVREWFSSTWLFRAHNALYQRLLAFPLPYMWHLAGGREVWTKWMEARDECAFLEDAPVAMVVPPVDTTIPATVARSVTLGEEIRGSLVVTFTGDSGGPYNIQDALPFASTQHTNVIYPIVVTTGLLFQPAKCDRNHLLAIGKRLLKQPFPPDGPDAPTRWKTWETLTHLAVREGLFDVAADEPPDPRKLFQSMGSKGKRFLIAMEQEEKGIAFQTGKVVNLKWNELLPPKDGDLKPRSIISIHQNDLGPTIPWAHYIAGVIHTVFDGKVHFWHGIPVRCVWAAGATPSDMDDYGRMLLDTSVIVILVSGDDSLIVWGPFAGIMGSLCGEADQSAFDHTQDEGPLIVAANIWMKYIGVPEDIIAKLQSFAPTNFVVRTKTMSGRGTAGVQMPTGTSVTSVQSSLHTILMYYACIGELAKNKSVPIDVPAIARSLGFTVKYKATLILSEATFLRGWWQLADSGLTVHWAPLPSLVLKLGKVLTAPEMCFKPRLSDRRKAHTMLLYALGRTMSGISRDYPILGPFLAMCDRLGKSDTHYTINWNMADPDRPFKSYSLGTSVKRSAALEVICRRYDLQESDILECERQFERVYALPCLLSHPVFVRLAQVDYQ